jgi:hypothetical protein
LLRADKEGGFRAKKGEKGKEGKKTYEAFLPSLPFSPSFAFQKLSQFARRPENELTLSRRSLTSLTLALLPIIYFYPAALGYVVLAPGDGWAYHMGVRVLAGRMIAAGQLPLWNPSIFGGMPLLASIEPGVLYPANWLFAFLPPGLAFNLAALSTCYVALAGTYLYTRRVGVTRLGAVVAATAFAFGGFMTAHVGNLNLTAPAAWLPWLLLAVEQLKDWPRWRLWLALGACCVALQVFAGHPQITLYLALVVAAYALFTLLRVGEGKLRFAAKVAAMAFIGASLSAIQLMPTWQLGRQGARSTLTYEYFASESLPPRALLTLVFPYFFGGAASPTGNLVHWGEQPYFFGASALFKYGVAYWGDWGNSYMLGYVGMAGLLLALVAVAGLRRNGVVLFWAALAVVAVVLACGGYLPFGINQLLHRVPVYKLMRAPYRHLFEFTFAAAVLAGFGLSYVEQREWRELRRVLLWATSALTLLVAFTAIVYRSFQPQLGTTAAPPAHAGALTNVEAVVPLVFFALSVAALWLFALRRSRPFGLLLALILFADLMSLTQFGEWRGAGMSQTASVAERLADPPALQFIKSREPDLQAFRVLSYSPWPYGENYDGLNYPNLSAARGVESAGGYNAFRLSRVSEMAGDIGIEGLVADPRAFGLRHEGLNLLDVKYLLRERLNGRKRWPSFTYDGVRFSVAPVGAAMGDAALLQPGSRAALDAGMATADELALVTTLVGGREVADDAPLAAIKIHFADGRSLTRELRAGRDTAEWEIDRVASNVHHRRAKVVESWKIDGQSEAQGHRYLARYGFDRAPVAKVEFEYVGKQGGVYLVRASLRDSAADVSTPLDGLQLPPERWRRLGQFGDVEVYENLRVLPRAWVARRVETKPGADVLRSIKEGQSGEGATFDPRELALLDAEQAATNAASLPAAVDAAASVKVVGREASRVELETNSAEACFVMLGEVHYPGWEVKVDGRPAPLYRADYALRGVAVPAGAHRVEVVYRPKSFRRGALISAFGVALLVGGLLITRRFRRA